MWQLEKVLRAMHILFHNVPARREDFTALTKSTTFPLPFCGHRWIENLPVAERAVAVWPSLTIYLDAVRTKKLPNSGTASFDTLEASAKLQFYMAITRTFSPFLTRYQTDEPVTPFLTKGLAELMKSMLRHFVKRELLHDISPLQLVKLDVSDKKNWVHPTEVKIGLGAESVLKVYHFLISRMDTAHDVRKLLLLSHGQATVERGFSVNKEVEICNMQEDTVIAQCLICDYVTVCVGVLKVPLSKEMLASAASPRWGLKITGFT
ncbi:hypothetical protein AAFF_G00147910 [Aldrovandia affinis]|uniref:Uncharacterized protein n=1 Tax=Aldrovandia affinis TaxID=143900 RepID=A0AAD7RPR9_9TELE|nr:hypothetical protein AAFF_G00147910 [Aldrovandia affinis]